MCNDRNRFKDLDSGFGIITTKRAAITVPIDRKELDYTPLGAINLTLRIKFNGSEWTSLIKSFVYFPISFRSVDQAVASLANYLKRRLQGIFCSRTRHAWVTCVYVGVLVQCTLHVFPFINRVLLFNDFR